MSVDINIDLTEFIKTVDADNKYQPKSDATTPALTKEEISDFANPALEYVFIPPNVRSAQQMFKYGNWTRVGNITLTTDDGTNVSLAMWQRHWN